MSAVTEIEALQSACIGPENCGRKADMPIRGRFCIGSACKMGWRKTGSKCRDLKGNLVDRDLDGTGNWIDVGYCGLAGAP